MMHTIRPKSVWQSHAQRVAARLSPALLGFPLAASEREAQQHTLRQRLVSMCLLVALGVVGWIPCDARLLPEAALSLATLRIGLAVVLCLIAWNQHRDLRLPPAVAIALFIGIQALSFAWMQAIVPADAPPLLQLGYGLFPFIIAAEIAVFPLPLLVSLALSAPSLGLLLTTIWRDPGLPDLSTSGSVWLLLLIILISSWAGTSQLLLLIDLLRARNDAAHDGLTGLANRRAAMAHLEADIANAKRHHRPLALLMLDLDHFKQVNDANGHAAGDRVLIEFAATLRDHLRLGDLGARIGGEEFIAILPDADVHAAQAVSERIRTACEAQRVAHDGGRDIRFTISIGIAPMHDSDNTQQLIDRADRALYQAKHTGRNRVAVSR